MNRPAVFREHCLTLLVVLGIGFASGVAMAAPVGQQNGSPNAVTAQQIEQRYKQDTDSFEKAFDEFEKSAPLGQEFHHDLSSLAVFLQSAMHDGDSPEARQTAALYLLMMRDYLVTLPSATYLNAAQSTPAKSALWKKSPRSIGYVAEELTPAGSRHFLNDIAVHNSDRAIQGQALIALVKLERRQHNSHLYQATFQRLLAYKDIEGLSFEISMLNPDNKIAVGKKAPFFTLPEIGKTNAAFSNKSLAGKYYLLDFWATWCGPCVAERGALLRAYQHYKAQDFAIVSISLDKTPDAVIQYRHARWAMPWENLFLPDGQKSQTAKDFDVDWIGLPRLILVDPDGTVVALQDDLGRDTLARTLAKYLKN